jgi:hypothetical protein
MNKNAEMGFDRAIWIFIRIWAYLAALSALIIIPVDLWLAWVHRSTTFEPIIGILVHVFWGWALLSVLQFCRGFRKLSQSERTVLFSTRCPTSPEEVAVWKWGWQFAYAVIAVLATMAAEPVTAWLAGK